MFVCVWCAVTYAAQREPVILLGVEERRDRLPLSQQGPDGQPLLQGRFIHHKGIGVMMMVAVVVVVMMAMLVAVTVTLMMMRPKKKKKCN
jgi:hypothetical protein